VTGLEIGFSGVVDGMYSVKVDVSKFSIIGFNGTGVFLYSDCTSLQVAGINCTITITNTTKILTITNNINNTSTSFPTSFNITLPNLLKTPLLPSSITPNPYTISITGYDSSLYYIYNSPDIIKFQTTCTMPCATCSSRF
jgi:hypothetical protein